jgi:DNA polymerase III subunit epsilon
MGDPADLEQLARQLEQASDYRVLRRVPEISRYATEAPATAVCRSLIVDVETTDLDPMRDTIIELAILPFDFSSAGGLYAVHEGYTGFEDPAGPCRRRSPALPASPMSTSAARRSTTRGSPHRPPMPAWSSPTTPPSIAASRSAACRSSSTNPGAAPLSRCPGPRKVCAAGASTTTSIASAWFFAGHRAMNDCRATLHLLPRDLPMSGRPALAALLQTARRRSWCLRARVPHRAEGGPTQGRPLPLEQR